MPENACRFDYIRSAGQEIIMTIETTKIATARPRPSMMSALRRYCDHYESALYAVLRIVFGIVLFTHGLPKALGTSHGSMADPMAGSINLIQNVLGLPFAPQLAFLVMLLETGGAIMLVLGLCTRRFGDGRDQLLPWANLAVDRPWNRVPGANGVPRTLYGRARRRSLCLGFTAYPPPKMIDGCLQPQRACESNLIVTSQLWSATTD